MPASYCPQGVFSAQWIPTDAAGQVQRSSLAAHLAFQRAQGIDGVLALGSTGEFPQFTLEERKRLLETIRDLAGPITVMANITDINPRAAVDLGRFARRLGLPVVALMPPIFFPVKPADMLAYFLHVAEAVDLPVLLYNFPELTGKKIDLDTVAAFADRAPMAGIKQSGGEFAYHRDLIALGREKQFSVMSGADTRLPEVFALGAAGAIGGLVNIVPELMVHLYRQRGGGRTGDVAPAAAQMTEVGRIIDQLTFPINVAAGLAARGFDPGVPKSIVSAQSRQISERITSELRARFQEWGLVAAQAVA